MHIPGRFPGYSQEMGKFLLFWQECAAQSVPAIQIFQATNPVPQTLFPGNRLSATSQLRFCLHVALQYNYLAVIDCMP